MSRKAEKLTSSRNQGLERDFLSFLVRPMQSRIIGAMSCFQLITEPLIERIKSCHKHSQIKQKFRFNSVYSGAHDSRPSIVSWTNGEASLKGGRRGEAGPGTSNALAQPPPLHWHFILSSHQMSLRNRWKLQTTEPLIIDLHSGVSERGAMRSCKKLMNQPQKYGTYNWIRTSERVRQSSDKLLDEVVRVATWRPRTRDTPEEVFFSDSAPITTLPEPIIPDSRVSVN